MEAISESYSKKLTLLLSMRHVRMWEDSHLPIYGSLLGRDLILLLAQHQLEKRHFTLKEIYYSLPYSENAIRLHLQRLEREGWLSTQSPAADRRFRSVTLSRGIESKLDTYVEMLINAWSSR